MVLALARHRGRTPGQLGESLTIDAVTQHDRAGAANVVEHRPVVADEQHRAREARRAPARAARSPACRGGWWARRARGSSTHGPSAAPSPAGCARPATARPSVASTCAARDAELGEQRACIADRSGRCRQERVGQTRWTLVGQLDARACSSRPTTTPGPAPLRAGRERAPRRAARRAASTCRCRSDLRHDALAVSRSAGRRARA